MSSLRRPLARAVAKLVTSERRQNFQRGAYATRRRLMAQTPVVHYFHQFEDPYSQLAATQLEALQERYHITLRCHPVPQPDAAMAPQAAALAAWALRDATRWAAHFELPAPRPLQAPSIQADSPAALERGRRLRARLGHYQGAMFYFEGEWYWGLDRLHYLENRLCAAGLHRDAAASTTTPLFAPPALQWQNLSAPAVRPTLHFFCSLRSPYTWLAVERVRRLAQHYGATLRIDYLLPMVMRGLPVPWIKRRYILLDAKREATRLDLPFGDILDPVGRPTERGLAVLQRAIERGCGEAFLESFLRGVFAEGCDAGSDDGLIALAERAGLQTHEVTEALRADDWRRIAEQHRETLTAGGLWGVPSFQVAGFPAIWGQDRLWMVEQDLIAARQRSLDHPPPNPPLPDPDTTA